MNLLRHYIHYLIYVTVATVAVVLSSCSEQDISYDFTSIGEEVEIEVPVIFPRMEARSRADISQAYLNEVQSLWIATYSSVTGELTSMDSWGRKGWIKVTPPSSITEHKKYTFSLRTLSGPSYIVAVANTGNKGVHKSNPEADPGKQQTLAELLNEADTWVKFLDIATPSPSNTENVNAPPLPLAMSGTYINRDTDYKPEEWEHRNFDPYTIPQPSGTGNKVSMPGCIHLRRLVSHIKFNIKSGSPSDIAITPHSYRVVNAPAFTWLFERQSNYGDDATISDRDAYYKTPGEFGSSFFTRNDDSDYSFDFWLGENKHTGTVSAASPLTSYEQRDKYTETTDGLKLFTSLTGDTWTPNNMATYIVINCTVDYLHPFYVDEEGNVVENPGADDLPSNRTGTANFIIHLGYMDKVATDFNSYRNVAYTYNVTVNGLNDIRLEAICKDETPGVEGLVSDVQEPTVYLDCHYSQFNVCLTKDELRKWVEHVGGSSEGFGFIITTYDNLNGGRKSYNESSPEFAGKTYDEVVAANPEIKKYIDWVEFRKTKDENTYAVYEPRGGSSGETFNLLDASRGIDESKQRSSSDWYTIFVKEYTYDYGYGSDEKTFVNGKPQWHGYVNADPRQFFIRVTKAVSDDGHSIYAHAKYAISQNSILTYYNTEITTTSASSSKVQGSALGMEHTNESFGLKLRSSLGNTINNNKISDVNGRANLSYYTNDGNWSRFINRTVPQRVPVNAANTAGELKNLPQTVAYSGTKSATKLDPNPDYTAAANFIEGIAGCINRNRDLNGNGKIDTDELRWYVPVLSKYLQMVLGSHSLGDNAIINFTDVKKLEVPSGVTFANELVGKYLFYSSDNNVLWSMEGMSTSTYSDVVKWSTNLGYTSYPQQIRCVRNLGTNLTTVATTDDPIIVAYESYTNSSGRTCFKPTFYNLTNIRQVPYTGGNGNGSFQMPVHSLVDYDYNSIYRNGFEVYRSDASTITSNVSPGRWTNLRNTINGTGNPCSKLTGNGWRLPNINELAIMRNYGLIRDNWYLSCTMAAFDNNGTKVTPYDNTTTTHFFLWALTGSITQSWKDHTSALIRCVRDITE